MAIVRRRADVVGLGAISFVGLSRHTPVSPGSTMPPQDPAAAGGHVLDPTVPAPTLTGYDVTVRIFSDVQPQTPPTTSTTESINPTS